MTVNEEGFCTACRHWVLQYPQLACPWCSNARTRAAEESLHLSPDTSAAAVLRAVQAAFVGHRRRYRELVVIRAQAARAILRAPDVSLAARGAGARVATLERWALADNRPKMCRGGHLRSEHGYKDDRNRWHCHECDRLPRAPISPAAAARTDRARLAQAHAEHAKRMALREQLLQERDDDLLPGRLRAPLPPPPL